MLVLFSPTDPFEKWMLGDDWPNQVRPRLSYRILSNHLKGEVDILEGVNDDGPNQSTLHTSAGAYFSPYSRVLTWPRVHDAAGVREDRSSV